MIENWMPVLDYEGLYEVSDFGRVKSLEKIRLMPSGGKRIYPGKIMKQNKSTWGYLLVPLSKNGKIKRATVHRLVYESFNGKTNLQIDHIIEGDKTDNRLSNLQAISSRENVTKYHLSKKISSQYIGVCWDKRSNKWLSQIRINKKTNFLGYFTNEYDAHLAYQSKLSEL